MKKFQALLLAVCLLLPGLTACGRGQIGLPESSPDPAASAEPASAPVPPSSTKKREYDMIEHPLSALAGDVILLGERTNITDAGLVLEWACSGFEMTFTTPGTDIALRFNCGYTTYFKTYLDGTEASYRLALSGNGARTAWKDVPAGTHTLRLIKDGQPDKNGGSCTLASVSLDGEIIPASAEPQPLFLEFIGDSIWTGVGALGNQGSSPTYSSEISATVATPYRTASALGADYNITARGSIGVIAKAGDLVASDLFSRLNGYRDETPYEPRRSPDAVIICLGANDPSAEKDAFVEQGVALIQKIRAAYGEGTKIVWTYGMFSKSHLVNEIRTIAERCGGEASGVYCLQMIYGQNGSGSKETNRHPSASDHEKNAAVLIPFLQEILGLS